MGADYPLRRELHDELHARPSLYFETPAVIWHEAYYVADPSLKLPRSLLALNAKITRDGKSGIASVGHGAMKWEVHTEFVSLTHFLPWNGSSPNLPQRSQAWTELCKSMPGERIASIEVLVAGPDSLPKALLNADGDAVASIIGGGDAEVWSTFRWDENAATRFVMINRNLNAYRAGRMVRRLLEIEVYRMLAAISHPLSQEAFLRCAVFDKRLRDAMDGMASQESGQELLLQDLKRLSTDILDFSGRTRDRFSATAAYAELVFKRLDELREDRVEGHQRLGVFIDRRFRPSVRATAQADARVENVAVRIARASELLRTSVQVELELQNGRLLESMERRVKLQTRLQEAVESFSIVAISYYILGILKLFIEGLSHVYEPLASAKDHLFLFVIPVLAVVWLIVRRMRSTLMGASHTNSDGIVP